ncbi:DUF222 domain-containing protein [Kribbella sp. CWNU-51]
MELLGARPVWSMSGSEKLAALDALEADLARRQTYRLHLIASLDHDGYAQEIGAHDTTQLLAFRYRLDRPQARRDVRLAQTLSKYAAVSAALPATGHPGAPGNDPPADSPDTPTDAPHEPEPDEADQAGAAEGFLRPAQAEAIVTALEKVPDTVPVEDLDVAERELLALARHLSPAELRKAGQRVRDILDTDGPEPDEHHAYARESLTLTGTDRGVKFRGYLANENAELLRSLIHAGARPHRTHTGDLDPRPRDKRQADALTTALTLAATAYDTTTTARPTDAATAGATTAGAGAPGAADARTAGAGTADVDGAGGVGGAGRIPGFGAKANITVTIDLQDLKSAAADAIGDVVYGDGLSAATIRRLACDAKIIPLVLGSKSEPLDVGRAERLVTGAMRRALNARDTGCVVCGAPPVQCDAHHLQSWIDGGATAVHNLCLLCRRHHVDLHHGEWTITITDGEVHVARPAWADPPPQHTTRPARQPDPCRPRHQPAQQPPPQPPPPPPPPPPPTGPSTTGASRMSSPHNGHDPSGSPHTGSPHLGDNPSAESRSPSTPEPGAPTPRPPEPGATTPRPPEPGATTPPEPGATASPMPRPERGTPSPPSSSGPEPGVASPSLPEPADGTASLGESGGPTPVTLVAASDAAGSASRRTATGAEVLRRLLAAKGESAEPLAGLPLREAANLAIWGEPSTPPAQPLTTENHTSDRDQPLAPSDDQLSEPLHGLRDDRSADERREAVTASEPARWLGARPKTTASVDAPSGADSALERRPA